MFYLFYYVDWDYAILLFFFYFNISISAPCVFYIQKVESLVIPQ